MKKITLINCFFHMRHITFYQFEQAKCINTDYSVLSSSQVDSLLKGNPSDA